MKKIVKKIAAAVLAVGVCMAMFIAVYLQYFQYVDEKSHWINLNDAYNAATAPLESGVPTTQEFSFDGAVYGVGFVFDMIDFSEEGELIFTLSDESGVVAEQSMQFSSLARERYYTVFALDEPLSEGKHRLTASLEARYADPETPNKLTAYKTDSKATNFYALSENGESAEGSLAVQVVHQRLGSSVTRAFWIFAIIVSAVTGGVCFLLMSVDVKKAWVVFLLLVLAGVMYQVVLQPYSAPDELCHYNNAYRMSNDWLGIENVDGAVVKRRCDLDGNLLNIYTNAFTYKYVLENFFTPAGEGAELVVNPDAYLNGYRLPRIVPAIGITISRLLGFGGILTAYFTRFLCLLSFAAMATAAYHFMPFAKALVPAIAMLPIVLHNACTPSYDRTVLGLALMLVALMLAVTFGDEKNRKLKLAVLAAVCVAIAPLKSVYITLPFLVLLIPTAVFSQKSRSYIYKGAVLGLALFNFARFNLSFVFSNIVSVAAVSMGEAAAASGGAVAAASEAVASQTLFSVSYLLAHIDIVIPLVLNTFFRYFTIDFLQVFGNVLSWLSLQLNPLITFGFIVVVLAAVLPVAEEGDNIKARHRIVMGILALATYGMLIAGCLTWTPTYSDYIEGFQGRYILPILPMIMLAIRPSGIVRSQNSDAFILGGAWLFTIMAILGALVGVLAR